jgi:TRAP-type C4-dicarboxylate transport system permease small subunit
MSEPALPVEAGGQNSTPASGIERITGKIAVIGGFLAMAVAILVTASVLLRWFFNAPIDGDFEFVKIATAIAIFAYLPYTQARRGNIMVDTFTGGWLSPRTNARLDAVWDLTYAFSAVFCTYALMTGTLEAIKSGETTMQRQLLVWPGIGICALLSAFLAVTAFLSARDILVSPAKSVQS